MFFVPIRFPSVGHADGDRAGRVGDRRQAIERKHFKDIRELLGVTTRYMVIGGCRVPAAKHDEGDAGHELAKGQPFAACYWDTPEGRAFSLRSQG